MTDLTQGQIGPEAKYVVKFDGGKLVAQAAYDGAQFDADVVLKLDATAVVGAIVDKAEEVIPGDQKALAEMLKAFLAGLMK